MNCGFHAGMCTSGSRIVDTWARDRLISRASSVCWRTSSTRVRSHSRAFHLLSSRRTFLMLSVCGGTCGRMETTWPLMPGSSFAPRSCLLHVNASSIADSTAARMSQQVELGEHSKTNTSPTKFSFEAATIVSAATISCIVRYARLVVEVMAKVR